MKIVSLGKKRIVSLVKDLLGLIRHHRTVAAIGFVLGILGWLAVGRAWPKYYVGSARLAWNPQTQSTSKLGGEATKTLIPDQLQQATARVDWAAIFSRYHPYPEIEKNSGLAQAAAYLAAQVSIQQVADPALGTAVKIDYTNSDHDRVLGIVDAVADGLAEPVSQPIAQSNKASEEPLYAPVILPDVTPVKPSHPLKRHGKHVLHAKRQPSAAVLSKKLEASLADGERLHNALRQNESTLHELREAVETQRGAAKAAAAPPTETAATEANRKPSPQEEHLRQELAGAQQELDMLRVRYTDEYPDVVSAREKVQEIKLDLDRLAESPTAAKATLPRPQHSPARRVASPESSVLYTQLGAAEAAQIRLNDAITRNEDETASLQARLAKANESETSSPETPTDIITAAGAPETDPSLANPGLAKNSSLLAVPQAPTETTPSSFFLVRQPTVSVRPAIFATVFLWPFSLGFGFLAALLAAWLAEWRDPSIRNEGMLRREIPTSAVYLGGIPRIRHEVVVD